MEKSLMLTVIAWNDLFLVALRVCKISVLSGLSFPRFRLCTTQYKLDSATQDIGLRSFHSTYGNINSHSPPKFPSPLFQDVYSKKGLVPSLQGSAFLLPFKYCPLNILSNLVLTQTKVISIRRLRMRIIIHHY